MKGQPFIKRVGFALHGLRLAVQREGSLRTHLLAAAAVLVLLLATRPEALWWALLALAVGLVLVAELVNSALEALIDHLHPDSHPEIGAAKDIAAGAALVASGVALLVGVAFVLDWLAS
ncbi:MAG TPA: diacylglycerol kinase [Pseudomonas sp.]